MGHFKQKDIEQRQAKKKSPVDELLESYGIDPETVPDISELEEKLGRKIVPSMTLPPLEEEEE